MNEELKITYLLILVLIISFVLNPFIKKKALNGLDPNEFLIVNHIIYTFFLFFYTAYLVYNNKCDINCWKKMNSSQYYWSLLAVITGFFGTISLIYLVSRDEVTFIIPNVQPIVIAIGAFIGYYLFNESMRFYKLIGIILVVLGAICINIDKIKHSN